MASPSTASVTNHAEHSGSSPGHDKPLGGPTASSTWMGASGVPINDKLLEWPADVFALTNVVLARAEAFRFALSGHDWPPSGFTDWAHDVEEAARRWSSWAESRTGMLPELVTAEWHVFRERLEVPLAHLAGGHDDRGWQALLTLHAIADEACAGLGIALDTFDADGCLYRARGRELLARTGSLSRIDPRYLRVLPKVRTPPTGRPAFSRYASVQGPGIDVRWHKIPARHRGTDLRSEYATLLLLPWPLQVRASDFRAVDGSVNRLSKDPYGLFEFAPAERLDLDLLDRVLLAARAEAGSVDVVLLPESSVDKTELDDLEALLDHHGVIYLQAGVREPVPRSGPYPNNWMHIGVNPRLEKGPPQPTRDRQPWFHLRQNKHHPWSLDESQVDQYHLGSALHPHIRWWEAMDVPRRAIQIVEVAEMVLVAPICEDLAQNDDIAQLIRSVGPTAVIVGLLDGPQLASRWSARYASVLTDDPGSSVLALSSFGMVQRSRPDGTEPSRVVALWKDPTTGVKEIPLEPGAQAVLLTVAFDRATRYAADRRWPVDNSSVSYAVAVHQVSAFDAGSPTQSLPPTAATTPLLETEELTILTAWAEGVSEAAAHAPDRVGDLLAEAHAGSPWRAELGLPQLSPRLADAIKSLSQMTLHVAAPAGTSLFDALLTAAGENHPEEEAIHGLVRHVLLAVLEERRTRQPTQADHTGWPPRRALPPPCNS